MYDKEKGLFDAFVAFYAYDPRAPDERTAAEDRDADGEADDLAAAALGNG